MTIEKISIIEHLYSRMTYPPTPKKLLDLVMIDFFFFSECDAMMISGASKRFDFELYRSGDFRKHCTRRDFLCHFLQVSVNFFFVDVKISQRAQRYSAQIKYAGACMSPCRVNNTKRHGFVLGHPECKSFTNEMQLYAANRGGSED